MKISKLNLRQLFAKGLKPTQDTFYNLFDSYWHKDELIDLEAVKDLKSTLDNKLDSSVEETLLTAFNDVVSNVKSFIKGEATPTSSPTPWVTGDPKLYEKWEVRTAGTYINFKDSNGNPIVITALDIDKNFVYINMTNNVAKKDIVPIPVATAKQVYDKTDNVNPASMKTASDWLQSTYIGAYPEFQQPNRMDLPYEGFAVENGNAGLPNSLRYFPDYSLLKDRYIYKIRAKAASVGQMYIFIYKKSDMTLFQAVLVDAQTEIFEYTFATPIDSNFYLVTFSQGFMYFPTAGARPVKNFTPGSSVINDNATITLAVEYYTSPSLTLPPSKKIAERLDSLEHNTSTVEVFEWSNLMLDNTAIGKILTKESSSSVFSLTDGKLTITSNTTGNGVLINNNIYLNKRCLEFDIKISDLGTVVYFGSKPNENLAGATTYTVDFSAKKINGVTDFSTMDVNTTDTYRISLSTVDFQSSVKVKNLRTTQEFINTFSVIDMYDQYKIGFISGTGIIDNIRIFSMAKERPYIMFFGDSITRASNIANNKRFANLIGDLTGREYLVSGRSAGTIIGVLSRMVIEIPTFRPKYVCVTIGTNGGNTVDNLTTLVNFCEKYGCKVILNRTPMFDGNTAAKNTMIDGIVSSRKLLSIKMDIATSVGFDGVTKDNSCFSNESGIYIHPNEKGHQQAFDRAKIDIEEVFINAGVA